MDNQDLIRIIPPTTLTGTAVSETEVSLTWPAVLDATSYRVYRANSQEGPFTLLGEVTTNTTYLDTGLTSNTRYYYRVTSYSDAEGESEPTQVVEVTTLGITTPLNLVATPLSNTSIGLTWTPVLGAQSYNILRSNTEKGPFMMLGNVTTTNYVDTSLTPNTRYYYNVTAINGTAESDPAQANAITLISDTEIPLNVISRANGCNTILTTWTPVTGAISYNVYRSNTLDGPFTLVGNVLTTTYNDTNLLNNTAYYYQIRAVTTLGEGEESGLGFATTNCNNRCCCYPTYITRRNGRLYACYNLNNTGCFDY